MTHALHSSERVDWQTPAWFLDQVRRVGPIECDPATAPNNPTGARQFYASAPRSDTGIWLGQCGLVGTWPAYGLTFINPPYGAHLDGPVQPDYLIKKKGVVVGVGRGWAARIAAHRGDWIALVPNRTETDWFRTLWCSADRVCFPERRISFVNPDTGLPGNQPNHGSAVFYAGFYPEHFIRSFTGIHMPAGRSGLDAGVRATL